MKPMLASPGTVAALRGKTDYSFELKWDGYRSIVTVAAGRVRLVSRNGNDFTATFPDLVEPLLDAVTVDDAVLDGEIVTFNQDGRPDFGLLQTRGTMTRPAEVARAAARAPARLLLFDALAFDGHDLTMRPYSQRRQLLRGLVDDNPVVSVPPSFVGDADAAVAASLEFGLEGVVAKRVDSIYRPGRRSPDWIKVKNIRTQEVVVIGWIPGSSSDRSMGALVVAVPDEAGRLRYAGRVGTGFTERQRQEITTKLQGMPVPEPAAHVPPKEAANWVRPELVGEVAFLEWTRGGTMRHPSWRGWRPDKDAADVVIEP